MQFEYRLTDLRDALEFYAGEAKAAYKQLSTANPNEEVIIAILTVISNDCGRRAEKAMRFIDSFEHIEDLEEAINQGKHTMGCPDMLIKAAQNYLKIQKETTP